MVIDMREYRNSDEAMAALVREATRAFGTEPLPGGSIDTSIEAVEPKAAAPEISGAEPSEPLFRGPDGFLRTKEEMDNYNDFQRFLEQQSGGVRCKNTDFSFGSYMRAERPPKIMFIGLPADLMKKSVEQKKPIDHYCNVPDFEPESFESGVSEEEEVMDILDTHQKLDNEVEKRIAPQLMMSFEEYNRVRKKEQWEQRRLINVGPLDPDNLDSKYVPHTVRNPGTHGPVNLFYRDGRVIDLQPKKKKQVVTTEVKEVDVSKNIKRVRKIFDTLERERRARLQAAENELKGMEHVKSEMLLLQTEKDRATTEFNTLDPARDAEQIYAIRKHIDKIDQKIDGINLTYGIEPQTLREPSAFESAVRKVRGAGAYVVGKVVSGVKGFFKGLFPDVPTTLSRLAIIGLSIVSGASLFSLGKAMLGG